MTTQVLYTTKDEVENFLSNNGPYTGTQSEIASRLGISQASVSKAYTALEAEGRLVRGTTKVPAIIVK